ncbi:cystathionine gamma-synthase [Clostridia bacterium]|nr:cystathionine gamma-synthase [Clostridia bacterium]
MRHIDTALIHGETHLRDHATGAVNIPIYQTSTYAQIDADLNSGKTPVYEYSRTGNPTRAALESLIATLESGADGTAYASGMAAITAVLSLFKSGDAVVIGTNVYGGTYRVLDKVFTRFGISYKIVDTSDLTAFEEALTDDVKLVLIETPSNPLLTLTDISAVASLTKKRGIYLAVDNTFMTPYLQRPIEQGADIVIHSATKYLGGHSDVIAGLVVVSDKELAERLRFIQNATGGILQPFDSYLLIRSIKTLGVRMDRHVENAKFIAERLSGNKAVKKLYYPDVGAMISFELADGHSPHEFFKKLGIVVLAESLGGVESLVCHPAVMTHASMPKEIREKAGITDSLVRLSVGIEDKRDLIADIENALAGN